MAELKGNYENSGLSTLEAIEDMREQLKEKFNKWYLPKGMRAGMVDQVMSTAKMNIGCDALGCDHRVDIIGCELINHPLAGIGGNWTGGTWKGTNGWMHINDLDFCPQCIKNGNADRSVMEGVRPLGAD